MMSLVRPMSSSRKSLGAVVGRSGDDYVPIGHSEIDPVHYLIW